MGYVLTRAFALGIPKYHQQLRCRLLRLCPVRRCFLFECLRVLTNTILVAESLL